MEDNTEETSAITTGKDILDATQNAVIEAVGNVTEIIETKQEEKRQEQLVQPQKPLFYTEVEFWVGMSFVLLILGLIFPLSKVVKSMLKKKISGIEERIKNAVTLRDDAQKLLADYERKLRNADAEGEKIIDNAKKEIELTKTSKLSQLEDELKRQTENVENKINIAVNNAKKEIADMICDASIKEVTDFCKNELSEKEKDRLIDEAITKIGNLK